MQTISTELNHSEAINRLDQIHSKLSSRIKQLSTKNTIQQPKEYKYVIYQPKKLDSATQTMTEAKTFQSKTFKANQQKSPNESQQRAELRAIVDQRLVKCFRQAKQKENILLNELVKEKQQNLALTKEIQKKQQDLVQVEQTSAQFESTIGRMQKEKEELQSQVLKKSEQVQRLIISSSKQKELQHLLDQASISIATLQNQLSIKSTQCSKFQSKQRQLQTLLSESKALNQHLTKQLSAKSEQISKLKTSLLTDSQFLKKPFEDLKKEKSKLETQHQLDLNNIHNLELGIDEYKRECERLTRLLSEKQSEVLSKSRRIVEVQQMYKQSENLNNAMAKEQSSLSDKLNNLQKAIRTKNSYASYLQDLYFQQIKENNKLQKEIVYFSAHVESLQTKIKHLQQHEQASEKLLRYYQKLTDKLTRKMKTFSNCDESDDKDKGIEHNQIQPSFYEEKFEKLSDYVKRQEQNFLFSLETQRKIFFQELKIQKGILQQKLSQEINLKQFLQQYLNRITKINQQNNILLTQQFQEQHEYSSDSSQSEEPSSTNQSQNLFQNFQANSEPHIANEINKLEEQQLQLTPQKVQSEEIRAQQSHKQNQVKQKVTEKIEEKIKEEDFVLTPVKKLEQSIASNSNPYTLTPMVSQLYRPPSFGKQSNDPHGSMHSDYIHDQFDTQTPHFSEASESSSHPTEGVPKHICLTQSDGVRTDLQYFGQISQQSMKKDSQNLPREGAFDFKTFKSQTLPPCHQPVFNIVKKPSQERGSESVAIQTTQHSKPSQSSSSSQPKTLECKQAYCQANSEHPKLSEQTQKQGKFIKKHESMTNCVQQLSPTNQKEQSDGHILLDKRKKESKKEKTLKQSKVGISEKQSKVVANEKNFKSSLNQLQIVHNIHYSSMVNNPGLRRVQKHKISSHFRLSERLSELIHRQITLEQQLSATEHHVAQPLTHTAHQHHNHHPTHHHQIPPTSHNPSTLVIFTQEHELMSQMQKILQQTYEWFCLLDKINKRETQRQHERLISRLRLKKTKTGVLQKNKIKQKESNEDCYETDTLFQLEKEKSVYSEGDTPRCAGDMDHFDISPFDHIQVPEKHQDIHSLQKLFKQGPEISQISSVKNQSQISQFINSRSEFVNIFDPKHFNPKPQEQEMHPMAASAYHDIEYNPTIHFHPNIVTSIYPMRHTHKETTQNEHLRDMHNNNRLEEKSIKSLRNICSKEKEKVKLLEKKIVDMNLMYQKFIEKMVDDDKRKWAKVQRDFNKALNQALRIKPTSNTNVCNTPSISVVSSTKEGQLPIMATQSVTSLKIVPTAPMQQKPPLPPLSPKHPPSSKLQSKSMTQINFLAQQKINQKDEILQEKIEELVAKNQQISLMLTSKTELVEQLQKKSRLQKVEYQKLEKKCEQIKKEVDVLKTHNKKIKNEFSQFMSKLVDEHQKLPASLLKFSKKTSIYDESSIKVTKDSQVQTDKFEVQNGQIQVKTVKNDQGHITSLEDNQNSPIIQSPSPILEEKKQKINQISSNSHQKSQTENQTQNKKTESHQQNQIPLASYQQQIKHLTNQIQTLRSQITTKNQTIESLTALNKQQSLQISELNQQRQKSNQQISSLNQQIQVLSLQITEKQGEISSLANSLNSIQNFERKLKQKLNQAEDKIKEHQLKNSLHQKSTKNIPQATQDNSKTQTNEVFVTPQKSLPNVSSKPVEKNVVSPINIIQDHSLMKKTSSGNKSTGKNRRGSVGDIQQNFFDLEDQTQFNNIGGTNEKDAKIKELYEALEQLRQKHEKLEQNFEKVTKSKISKVSK